MNSRNASAVINVLKVSFRTFCTLGGVVGCGGPVAHERGSAALCKATQDEVYVVAISLQRVMGEILRLPVFKLIIHSRHTSRSPFVRGIAYVLPH